jgi:hypothetical protein
MQFKETVVFSFLRPTCNRLPIMQTIAVTVNDKFLHGIIGYASPFGVTQSNKVRQTSIRTS